MPTARQLEGVFLIRAHNVRSSLIDFGASTARDSSEFATMEDRAKEMREAVQPKPLA
jgi:hypothetical protein